MSEPFLPLSPRPLSPADPPPVLPPLSRRECAELATEALQQFFGRRTGHRVIEEFGRHLHLSALAADRLGCPRVDRALVVAAVGLAERRVRMTEEPPTTPILIDCFDRVFYLPAEEWECGWPAPRLDYGRILRRLYGRMPNHKAIERLRAELTYRRREEGEQLTTATVLAAADRARATAAQEATIRDLLRELDQAAAAVRPGAPDPAPAEDIDAGHGLRVPEWELDALPASDCAEWWRVLIGRAAKADRAGLNDLRNAYYRGRKERLRRNAAGQVMGGLSARTDIGVQ